MKWKGRVEAAGLWFPPASSGGDYLRADDKSLLSSAVAPLMNSSLLSSDSSLLSIDSPPLSSDSPLLSIDSPQLSSDSPLLSSDSPLSANGDPLLRISKRLLANWREGSVIMSAFHGLLLLFPTPVVVLAEKASGIPVLADGQGWASFPRARPEAGHLVLRWQGQRWTGLLSALTSIDPASFWDGDLQYEEGQPLRAPLGPPKVMQQPKEEVRQVFASIPIPAAEQREWLKRLREPEPEPIVNRNPLLGLFDLMRSFFGAPENQKYVSKMVDLFEKENWQEALRYAIPLNTDSMRDGALERFMGQLRPRSELDFTALGSRSTFETSTQGIEMLRSLYQRALERLLRAGKIEEAAFVKGELLEDAAGAVALLEEHRRFEMAARLATVKGLPAALQVRLWFQAGKVEQALDLARRHFVHAEAMVALEQRDAALAKKFRLAWTKDLVGVGRVAEALQVGWEVRPHLPHYAAWMEQTLQAGEPAASQAMTLGLADRALCQELRLGDILDSWFADDDPMTLERRRAILQQIAEKRLRSSDRAVQGWAGRAARRLMRQANSPFHLGDRKVLDALVTLSDDPWLQVDKPTVLPQWSLRLDRWQQTVERRGRLPIFDAISLGDGRFLVALGHAGLAALSSRGATSQRFATPAHHLVVPQRGDRYLIVSEGRLSFFQAGQSYDWCSAQLDGFAQFHDGYHWLVYRGRDLYQIDLTPEWQYAAPPKDFSRHGSTSEETPSAKNAAAESTSVETASAQPGFLPQDDPRSRHQWASRRHAAPPPWRALEKITLPSPPLRLAVGQDSVGVLMKHHLQFYHSPSMAHISTEAIPNEVAMLTPKKRHILPFWPENGRFTLRFRNEPWVCEGSLLGVDCQDSYGIIITKANHSVTVRIFDTMQPNLQLSLDLPGTERARVRIQDHLAVISDNLGRLLVADLKTQQWRRQIFL